MNPRNSLTRRDALRALVAVAAATSLPSAEAADARTPNVVFTLCDDLGFGDLEVYGSPIHTPNLNRMAAEGMRFTNLDSTDSVCSSARAALLTGSYPSHLNVPRVLFPKDTDGLALDETTLTNVFKQRGYPRNHPMGWAVQPNRHSRWNDAES